MRNPRTLFIVGAGASKEAGLPVAKELVEEIANRLDFRIEQGMLRPDFGDEDILDYFQQQVSAREEIKKFISAAALVRHGVVYSNSIDTFIDTHRDHRFVGLCAKLAIAKTILEAERQSKMYMGANSSAFADVGGLKDTWYFTLARHLNDGILRGEIDRIFEKVGFVIFNYDRCLEHFLYHALQHHFGIDEFEAAQIMSLLQVVHPYGTISDLPWQSPSGIPFGFTTNRANLKQMISRIKTYTERVTEGHELARIRSMVREADTLVFLGFSYHRANMTLLKPEGECATERVFGTTRGIAAGDLDFVRELVRSLVGKVLRKKREVGGGLMDSEPLHLVDLTCDALLKEYSRSLFVAGHIGG